MTEKGKSSTGQSDLRKHSSSAVSARGDLSHPLGRTPTGGRRVADELARGTLLLDGALPDLVVDRSALVGIELEAGRMTTLRAPLQTAVPARLRLHVSPRPDRMVIPVTVTGLTPEGSTRVSPVTLAWG